MPNKKGPSSLAFEGLLRERFGLREYEVKVYLALLKGRATLKEVAATSKVPIPRVYDTVRSLEDKGFVQRTPKGPAAEPPRIALESRFRQLEAEAEEERAMREQAKGQLIPLLASLQQKGRVEGNEVVLIRGLTTIAQHLAEFLRESKNVFLLVRKALEAKDLFLGYVESLPLHRIRVQVILPMDAKITVDERRLASRLGVELRKHENPLLDVVVADRQHVILGVPDPLSDNNRDAIAVWVRNPSFAGAMRESLNSLWRESVKF